MVNLGINEKLIEACGDYGLASILGIVKKGMTLIQIFAPILLLVAATWMFIRMMINPEEKKYVKMLRNCFFAAIIVFFIPLIINIVMSWLDDSFSLTACWKVSDQITDEVSWNEQISDTGSKKPIYSSDDEYQMGS